ncbi:hypothetical protein DSO57_1028245 [Entomophthora muscae]|uniref:Uncharacterized protein n=1 Tax=Entomophthora muscae TaxID=34485 RepID=A0ACC2UBU8_9FUNG|nr:hypothetical protein DSO57_1028245 [Entomophthora muscae]
MISFDFLFHQLDLTYGDPDVPDYYCPPDTLFDPVHFTEYPLNPNYKPWTLEDLLSYTRPDATKDSYHLVCNIKDITVYTLIFNKKCKNYSAYLVPMEPPLTSKPTTSALPFSVTTRQSSHFLRVLYLTLTGLIDSALPSAGLWAVAGKALFYLIKLGSIIWCAMPVPNSAPLLSEGAAHFKAPGGNQTRSSHQAGLAGGKDLPTPGFLLFEANPGAGIIPVLVTAEGPVLGPRSYTQALVDLAEPGQANFIYPVNPNQAHPPLSNLGSLIGDPFFNQVPWPQESLASQPKNGDQIGKTPITPEANPARTNGQPSQDRPPKSQTTVPENPKNDHEAAN